MGTRAVIKIEGVDFAEIYKHWDGYPDHMLPWLEKFNKEFNEKRGDDPQYKFAQLLRSSAFDTDEFSLDPSRETGWGVVPSGYGDYAYLYILKKDGTVEVVG